MRDREASPPPSEFERFEADNLDDLYEEIAFLKGSAARDRFNKSWTATYRDITFSPIMIVFHEDEIDDARIEKTDSWKFHQSQIADAEKQERLEAELKAIQAKRAVEQRERAEFDRLAKKFGGRA